MSFRLKIILGVVAIQTLFLAMMIWNGLGVLRNSNEEALLQRTQTTAKMFAIMTQSAVLVSDLSTLDSFVSELLTNPGIVYARVRSNQMVLAEGGDKALLERKFVADTGLAWADHDGVYDAFAEIIVAGEKYGRVEIGFSTGAIKKLIADTRKRALMRALGGWH